MYECQANSSLVCFSDYVIEKTEIMWEDSWLDFLSSVMEFTSQFMEGAIQRVLIDPKHHAEEVKDCANLLAVMEIYTGDSSPA